MSGQPEPARRREPGMPHTNRWRADGRDPAAVQHAVLRDVRVHGAVGCDQGQRAALRVERGRYREPPDHRVHGDRDVALRGRRRSPDDERRIAGRLPHDLLRSRELERAEEERLSPGFVSDVKVGGIRWTALARAVPTPRPILRRLGPRGAGAAATIAASVAASILYKRCSRPSYRSPDRGCPVIHLSASCSTLPP